MKRHLGKIVLIIAIAIILAIATFSLPKILGLMIQQKPTQFTNTFQDFPVTVDPKHKIITENDQVNAFLVNQHSLLGAAVADAGNYLFDLFEKVVVTIANAPWYQNIANVNTQFVTIKPGMRKEQVATIFGTTLKWNNKQKQSFITPDGQTSLPLSEGSFAPGLYSVSAGMTPKETQTMINKRFSDDVLSHYGTSTQEIVPLDQALIIASLIQRETISNDGMRLLSGIMWNRLFAGMNLQIDSTLQYAKANKMNTKSWWPNITPKDKYISSPYNTYLHSGLPPTPISNPSVDAILAALNPVKTSCLFYFNDPTGAFHCSDTYAEHVSLIKKYYKN